MKTGTMFPIKTYKKKNFERCRCGASGDPLGPPHRGMAGWSRIRAHRNLGNHRKGGIKKYFREFGEFCVGLKTISIAIQEPFPARDNLDGAMFVADGTFFVKRDNNSAFAWICIGQFAKSVHFACPCGFVG